MPHALLISQQNPMKVHLSTALNRALKCGDPAAKTRVTALKYDAFQKQGCPDGIDVIVIDVDLHLVRAAMLKISELALGVPVLCFCSQVAPAYETSLKEVGATAVLMLAPNQVEKSIDPYIEFFTQHLQLAEAAA